MATRTIEQFVARAIRLYEQEPGEACASPGFGLYVRRWVALAGYGTSTNMFSALPPYIVTVVVYRPDSDPAVN